jgi:predicted aspartyl protease
MLTGGLRFCLLGVLLGAAAVRPALADDCQLAWSATLPLTFATHDSKVLIDVVANGAKLTMILDTGAEGIRLNSQAGQRVLAGARSEDGRFAPADSRFGYERGVGGSAIVTPVHIDNLVLGHTHGVFDAEAGNDFKLPDHDVDGLLGMTVLSQFDIDMDLAGHQVRLFKTSGTCSQPVTTLDQPLYAVPMRQSYHGVVRLLIPVTINGHAFTALLDSGAGGTFLWARTAEVLGLTPDPATAGKKLTGFGVAGKTTIFHSTLDSLAVGPLTLRHVPVAVDTETESDFDLLLGLDFMKRIHVWISNSSHTLVMQYPPTPSPEIVFHN